MQQALLLLTRHWLGLAVLHCPAAPPARVQAGRLVFGMHSKNSEQSLHWRSQEDEQVTCTHTQQQPQGE